MVRSVALALCLGAALFPTAASACQRMVPDPVALDGFAAIFIGHITGIHLEGYENRLLGKPDLVDPELGALTITNGASPVGIRVVVSREIRGAASNPMEFHLAGCTFDLPQLQARGIFFVLPGGTSVVVAWEEDQAAYRALLARLGVERDDL